MKAVRKTIHWVRLTLTPRSLRRGVRAGAIGVRLLGGLNILGVVGLRNGALGIPLRGAVMQTWMQWNNLNLFLVGLFFFFYLLVVSIFLTNPLPLAWKGTPAVFFSCWAVSVAIKQIGLKRVKLDNQFLKNTRHSQSGRHSKTNTNAHLLPHPTVSPPHSCGTWCVLAIIKWTYISAAALLSGLHSWASSSAGNVWREVWGVPPE